MRRCRKKKTWLGNFASAIPRRARKRCWDDLERLFKSLCIRPGLPRRLALVCLVRRPSSRRNTAVCTAAHFCPVMVSARRLHSLSKRSSRYAWTFCMLRSSLSCCSPQHANVPVEFERFDVSGNTPSDAALFRRSMDSLRRNKVGLKGAQGSLWLGR